MIKVKNGDLLSLRIPFTFSGQDCVAISPEKFLGQFQLNLQTCKLIEEV